MSPKIYIWASPYKQSHNNKITLSCEANMSWFCDDWTNFYVWQLIVLLINHSYKISYIAMAGKNKIYLCRSFSLRIKLTNLASRARVCESAGESCCLLEIVHLVKNLIRIPEGVISLWWELIRPASARQLYPAPQRNPGHIWYNISNTRYSVSSGCPNTEKRVENATRSGVFLTEFEVFG